MKIAIFTDTYRPQINGVVTSIVNAKEELEKRGHKVYVLAPKVDGEEEKNVFRFRSFPIIFYPEYRLALFPYPGIKKIIRDIKPDVIHSHGPFTMGLGALLCRRDYGIPVVGTFHTNIPEIFAKYAGRVLGPIVKFISKVYCRSYFNKCRTVIAPSKSAVDSLSKLGIKNLVPLSNGTKLDEYKVREDKRIREKYRINKNELMVLHVGRLSFEKNVEDVVRSAKIVCDKVPNARYVITSEGPAKQDIIDLAKKLGLEEKIIFTGYIPQAELVKLYSTSDLFVIPSTVETEGLVMLQALAAGLPVLAAKAKAIPDIIRDGKNGLLFEPRNVRELSEKTVKLLKDRRLRDKLAKKGQKSVKKYSVKKHVDELEKIYKKTVSG